VLTALALRFLFFFLSGSPLAALKTLI
jgi:hypothetical protein